MGRRNKSAIEGTNLKEHQRHVCEWTLILTTG